MSNYSNFENDIGKTRNEEALDSTLKDLKNYKNASQNFTNLDGRYFDDKNFFGLENITNVEDKDAPPNKFFLDPRYTQNNTRNESRKQLNNKTNLKIQNTLPGVSSKNESGLYEFNETNYEDPKFENSIRDLDLNKISIKETTKNKVPAKNQDTDLAKIIKKVKSNINVEEDIKPVLRMPKKNINANIVKGKIMQFKNCSVQIQDMICHALITIWKDDFTIKRISTYTGVKNFILLNFKDKMNCFFVLFDDDGDFISTFAIDTENFAPFISHIFVNPNIRNKGFGKKTLKYAEKYIKKLGFDTSHLWCEELLIGFYKKNGYVIDSPMKISEDKTIWKMGKNL
jgi:GNAT superfamily N-acetyltransferase